jgi:hypothetical protein
MSRAKSFGCVRGTNAGSQSLGWDADPALSNRRQETGDTKTKGTFEEKNHVRP